MNEILIPSGINFECSGCGHCCLEWPVPITQEDHQKIISKTGDQRPQFAPLLASQPKLKQFAYTLEKRADGKCEFLTVENLCWLHQNYGSETKPAMCQLFPYTFNPTPSGVYASLSFASTAVLMNSGQPLSQQPELLQEKYNLFCRLMPQFEPDWSKLQLVDGQPITWTQYLQLDETLLGLLTGQRTKRIEQRLLACSQFLIQQLPFGINLEREPNLEAKPKVVDLLLLKTLQQFYFDSGKPRDNQGDLDVQDLLHDLVKPPPAANLKEADSEFTAQQIIQLTLGELEPSIEDLLYRFVYCRVFAKLYFGFGFANLSLLVGIHHLIALIALVRLTIKLRQLSMKRKMDFLEVAEVVRTLERKLTMANLSAKSVAMLETLLLSPKRIDRILFLAS